jgi:hypothetical protein
VTACDTRDFSVASNIASHHFLTALGMLYATQAVHLELNHHRYAKSKEKYVRPCSKKAISLIASLLFCEV